MGIAERRERDRERRRKDIVDAAERVFFSKGISNATMDDVAESAELSKGTLYLYFKNKEDLYLAIVLRAIAVLQEKFEAAAGSERYGAEKITAIGRAYFEFCKASPDYFNAMSYFEAYIHDPKEDTGFGAECTKQSNKTFAICAEAVRVGLDDGSIRSGIDPMKIALTLYGLSTGLLQIISMKGELIQENHGVDPDELIETFFELIDKSLRP